MPDGPVNVEVRALYATALARCAADAEVPQASVAMARSRIEIVERVAPARATTATFVLCIENNAIRDQALLLCESIRQFGGKYRASPIMAFSPRAGLAVDGETRRVLAGMGVEYVDEPINTTCREYGPANRVFAGAWAEKRANTDFMVVLDSDTVYLQEPEMPAGDVAVRPVDSKGSATRGPGDAFEDYWVALAQMCGTTIDRLPYIRATIDGQRIRASYNAGLIVARRDKGIFTRGAELFSDSLEAGMWPYRGSGIDIYASTGAVGKAGSEFWGSSQAVLAIAIWATTDRVVHYPASYNVPLHLVASAGEIGADWCARPPVHVHYHYMFTPQRYEVAMAIMAQARRARRPARVARRARSVPRFGAVEAGRLDVAGRARQPLRKRSTTAFAHRSSSFGVIGLPSPSARRCGTLRTNCRNCLRRQQGVVEREASGTRFVLQEAADERDRFLGRALARHRGRQFRKPRGLADDEPVQRDRLGRQRRVEDEPGETPQELREIRAGDERHGGGRPQSLDDAVEDGAEERRLVA